MHRQSEWRLFGLALSLVAAFSFFSVLMSPSPSDSQARPSRLAAEIEVKPGSLLIVEPAVIGDPTRVNDPCKPRVDTLNAWSFAALMQGIAGISDGSEAATRAFIKDWLAKFQSDQPVNGDTVPARKIADVLKTWEAANWDLRLVPFQLLAILNRIDLLRSPLLAGENAGEVRFVFAAVVADPEAKTCNTVNFTVNLEYGVRKSSCAALFDYANKWVSLASPTPLASQPPAPGSNDYNAILWPLMDVARLGAMPSKPNGSAIDHVRTNENLDGSGWQMREFRLKGKLLIEDTVTLTPSERLVDDQTLKDYLNSIAAGLSYSSPDYWIPRTFPGSSGRALLGGFSNAGFDWVGKGHPPEVAINTCSGCHGGVNPGSSHVDPKNGPSKFLLESEVPRRAAILKKLAEKGCSADLSTMVMRMVH